MADEKRKNDQTARGMRGESFVRVKMEPSAPDNSAFGRGRQAAGVARQAGNLLANTARAVPAVQNPLGAGLVALLGSQGARVAARDAFDGFVGNPKGGQKVPVQPVQPVEEALAQGREAMVEPNEIAPIDRQSQMIAAILGSGLTVNEAASVAGILPQSTGKNAPSTKDTVMASAAALSRELYEGQIAKARALEATDPDGAKAAVESAAKNYFNQTAGLVGFNPVQLAQAQLMDQGGQ